MATKEVKKKAPAKAKPETKAIAVKSETQVKDARGRKTLLTPEVEKEIIGAIALGVPVRDAMKAQGINESSFYEWLKRGSDELQRLERNPDAKPNPSEVLFSEFSKAVERAKSKAVGLHVGAVTNAAVRGDWRASAWWLERQRPDEFGKDAVTFIANQTNNTQLNLSVTMGELEQLVDRVMAVRQENDPKTD